MSRIPVGADIIEIQRIEQAVLSWKDSFLRRVYTKAELEDCHNRGSSLAARFAAKEAVMKALGTSTKGIGWQDIEIISNNEGVPLIQPHGRVQEKAKELGINEFYVTMSHSKQYAIAFVISDAV